MSIVTTAPPLSEVVIIMFLRLVRCFIASRSPFDRLYLGFFIFFIFMSFTSC